MVKRIIYGTLFALLSAFIIFTSTRTGAENGEAGGAIISFINQFFFRGNLSLTEQNAIVSVATKLFGHYGLFLLAGLFMDLFLRELPLTKKNRLLIIGIYSICLGSAGEIVQIFSDGRYPTFGDVVIDVAGFHTCISLRYALEIKND